MIEAFATAVLLGAVNTLVDFVSVGYKLHTYGLYAAGRIMLVCYIVGTIIGARARQILIGSVGGLLIGALTAGVYQLLAGPLGLTGLAISWSIFWIAFAAVQTLLQGDTSAVGTVLIGLVAAAFSGMANFGLSNLAAGSTPANLNYLRLLFMWTGTFAPGFIVLYWQRS